MPLILLPILLLALPILEIAAFILVGDRIGLWPTLGLVVLNAVVGAALLRRQGLGALQRIRAETAAGRVPARELVDGVMIVAAGVLLLTPGFVTDVVGYLLFVPAVRAAMRRLLSKNVLGAASVPGRPGPASVSPRDHTPNNGRRPDVVDLPPTDYERRPDPASPWRGAHEGNNTVH